MFRAHVSRVLQQFSPARHLCQSSVMESSSRAKEVRFPVPWGHIAGKEWGNPDGKSVLALHGWLDNAGSFDKLIPRLSSSLHVVAIDLPGHGQSSHRPEGSFYHAQNYIADVKYVIDALKWETFSFLAHSMGTGIASWFSAALPELVECLVLVEGIGYTPTALENLPQSMGKALRGLSTLTTTDNKVYPTWDALVDRMYEGHHQMDPDFSRDAAATLCIRGSRQVQGNGYQFTRDLLVKAPSLLRIPASVGSAFISAVQCPVLLIVAERSSLMANVFNSMTQEQRPKQLKVVRVTGGHHVHLCQPEVLDRAVDSFLHHQTLHPDFQEISKL